MNASATATAATVAQMRTEAGVNVMVNSGSRAPSVKASIEAHAACQGLVRSSGSMPSSVSA